MKYKLWISSLFLCAIILSLVAPAMEGDVSARRYHQHLDSPAKVEASRGEGFATHLPLVKIETGGKNIPGRLILKDDGHYMQTVAEDGSDDITAKIDVIDNEKEYNHPGDKPSLSSKVLIHVRGNSSRAFDKPNYAIQLITDDGLNNPQVVMGMDAHHEWALHGPYLDKTLIKNYMWYNIGGEIMEYAPNVRFCELMIDGKYQGVYVMMEKVTGGKDGARLPLTVSAKNNTFSGYLLQLNGGRPPANGLQTEQFTYYSRRTMHKLDIAFPGTSNITPEIKKGIIKDFSDFEKALYSYDYDNDKYGYTSVVNTQSFIDYFLINEITCNYDAGRYSTYIYKDTNGKLNMCLWDMNSACDNYEVVLTDPMVFEMQDRLWFIMMMKDEDFVNGIIDRYWELRETYFSEEYLNDYIDSTIAYLGDSIDRNYKVWGYSFNKEKDILAPEYRNPRSFEESVTMMKEFFHKRIKWMDENIETLKQYSAESSVKQYNENTD